MAPAGRCGRDGQLALGGDSPQLQSTPRSVQVLGDPERDARKRHIKWVSIEEATLDSVLQAGAALGLSVPGGLLLETNSNCAPRAMVLRARLLPVPAPAPKVAPHNDRPDVAKVSQADQCAAME